MPTVMVSDWAVILAVPHNLKSIEFVNIYCSLLVGQHICRVEQQV